MPTEQVVAGSIPAGRNKNSKIKIQKSKIPNFYMSEALKEAKKAADKDEVPVGAVVVQEGKIISRGHNQVELLRDATAHAEMLALTSAENSSGAKWLIGASLYVTLEPCAMCAGALVLARVKHIYYGAQDPKSGACGSVVNIANHKKLNHRIKVKGGMMREECGELLKEFFRKKRL